MFKLFKEKKEQELLYLISIQDNTLDIVLKYPICIQGENISELTFELHYFFNWVIQQGLNLRIEVTYDSISETRRHFAKLVNFSEYFELPQEQIKNHISKFLNEYQKTQHYGNNKD